MPCNPVINPTFKTTPKKEYPMIYADGTAKIA